MGVWLNFLIAWTSFLYTLPLIVPLQESLWDVVVGAVVGVDVVEAAKCIPAALNFCSVAYVNMCTDGEICS